jgi:type IV secretory pathway VirB3-like protein
MVPLLILAVVLLVVVIVLILFLGASVQIVKEELAVHFRLLCNVDKNVAEILTKAETEEDV